MKKGQILFSIDRDMILSRRSQAKFTVDSLNQQIEFEKNRIGKAMEDYSSAKNDGEVQKQLEIIEEAQAKTEAKIPKLRF